MTDAGYAALLFWALYILDVDVGGSWGAETGRGLPLIESFFSFFLPGEQTLEGVFFAALWVVRLGQCGVTLATPRIGLGRSRTLRTPSSRWSVFHGFLSHPTLSLSLSLSYPSSSNTNTTASIPIPHTTHTTSSFGAILGVLRSVAK